MKKTTITFFVLMTIVMFTICSCNNRDTDPVPSEKKKSAWVTGLQDSTGYGMILFTPDAGETWIRQGQGSAALQGTDFSDVWAVDENNVWATGTNNTILNTTDGGQNWTRAQAPENMDSAQLTPICVVDKTNIWIGGTHDWNGVVYKSTNSGNTWSNIKSDLFQKNYIQGLWAITPEKVFVAGHHYTGSTSERGFIGYTIDGGVTWDSITPKDNFNKWQWIGVVAYGNTIVIYGLQAHYMVSTDGGSTWRNDSVPNVGGGGGPADINDLIMLDEQTWWGAFDYGNILITTDGGSTWNKQNITGAAGGDFLVGIDTWDEHTALSVSFANFYPEVCPILKTENRGSFWEQKYICHSQLWKVSFIKD